MKEKVIKKSYGLNKKIQLAAIKTYWSQNKAMETIIIIFLNGKVLQKLYQIGIVGNEL